MDLTPIGWIVLGLIAGIVSAVATGGRTPRGWMPSLAIGLVGAVLAGWFVTSVVGMDSINSLWVSALVATFAAIVLRYILKAFSFE
jgi:uncharacterized membrane protein YeaQ/YmgE (transglycosylase-associated protein family)